MLDPRKSYLPYISVFEHYLISHSGLMIAARLKALGTDSVIIDRNAQLGDNWTNRYDCLKFHVPTSNCELPYAREFIHPS